MSNEDRYKDLRKVAAVANSKDGMLVIKCKCGDEVRRIPILNRELTFDELCIMIHRLFNQKLSPNMDSMMLQYKDDEGDWIQLTDDMDISHAATLSSVITVRVFDKHLLPPPLSSTSDIQPGMVNWNLASITAVKKEIQTIQTRLDALLKILPSAQDVEKSKEETKKQEEKPVAAVAAASVKPLSTADMAELLENHATERRKSETLKSPVSTTQPVSSPPQQQPQQIVTQQPPQQQHYHPPPSPQHPQYYAPHVPPQYPQPVHHYHHHPHMMPPQQQPHQAQLPQQHPSLQPLPSSLLQPLPGPKQYQ